MEQRRFLSFLMFFTIFMLVYNMFIVPKLFPPPPVPVEPDTAAEVEKAAVAEEVAKAVDAGELEFAEHPKTEVMLGSTAADSGYFLQAKLSSTGAAIESVQLTDPKFKDLSDREQQVTVLGSDPQIVPEQTFATAIKSIDRLLLPSGKSLETVEWEVVSQDPGKVVFGYISPDKSIRVEKSFTLAKSEKTGEELATAMKDDQAGYLIALEQRVINLTDKPIDVQYELQGPVGVILENKAHTRKYRDIKLEFVDETKITFTPKQVSGLYDEYPGATEESARESIRDDESWTDDFRYAGVDVQFFAALVVPLDDRSPEDRAKRRWIARTYPVMLEKEKDSIYESNISFRMESTLAKIGPSGGDDTLVHKFGLFVGPKRSTLLDPAPLNAQQVLDYGSWFGFVARGMHYLLNLLHGKVGLTYSLAIISLTILVRSCMFPISRKQAISAARMKELQPKIKELQAKYGEDKEKFARAQMELWRKHKVSPFSGCLPVLLQFPVFIGLYTCLNTAVDLRLSSFLWIDNLAAPDALFTMPKLPWLGSDFNIFPCVTVVLFLIQQKLFMPPPADEQAEVTAKMMNFMTIFMGAIFWHQPAGLCLYFIASSTWSICERKLLGKFTPAMAADEPAVKVVDKSSGAEDDGKEAKPGFFGRLMAAAEEAQKQAERMKDEQEKSKKGKGNKGKKNKGKKGK